MTCLHLNSFTLTAMDGQPRWFCSDCKPEPQCLHLRLQSCTDEDGYVSFFCRECGYNDPKYPLNECLHTNAYNGYCPDCEKGAVPDGIRLERIEKGIAELVVLMTELVRKEPVLQPNVVWPAPAPKLGCSVCGLADGVNNYACGNPSCPGKARW